MIHEESVEVWRTTEEDGVCGYWWEICEVYGYVWETGDTDCILFDMLFKRWQLEKRKRLETFNAEVYGSLVPAELRVGLRCRSYLSSVERESLTEYWRECLRSRLRRRSD